MVNKKNYGILTAESLKENGPFDKTNRKVLIFSIGAGNESHGAALPSNIDDYAGIKTATTVCMRLGLTYAGHIPYSSDGAGPMAKDWNPSYVSKGELKKRMVKDIKSAMRSQNKLGNKPTHVAAVSGHGGNNFLKEDESSITKILSIPFLYVPPFPGGSTIRSNKHGRIVVTHADDGEHSVALYLGLLDEKKLRKINEIAEKDPEEALRQNPALMGLGYYVLPQLGGPKYEDLTNRHKDLLGRAKKFVEKDKKIIADYGVGRQLMQKNIEKTIEQIKRFIG